MYRIAKILFIFTLATFTYAVQGNNISVNKNNVKVQFYADDDSFSQVDQIFSFVPELENDQPLFNDINIEENYYLDFKNSGYRYYNFNNNSQLYKKANFLLLDIPPPFAG